MTNGISIFDIYGARRAAAFVTRLFLGLAVLASLIAGGTTVAQAGKGPFSVALGVYRFDGRSEPLVATDRKVDLWAQIYRPTDLSSKPFPLVIFLHGNHATCGRFDSSLGVRVDDRSDYTTTGKCPSGYVVVPNHLGYGYMASQLASWGYIVVSINANRGINAAGGVSGDGGLNLMRGRLILRHLALLSDWNRGTGSIAPPSSLGFNPVGTMDFSQVGLMGHSRGGEGARAALQQFRDSGSPFPGLIGSMTIRSIFEIGPVDGQTSRVLEANGVNSIILLPACDGDVSDLEGMHVFDRVFLRTVADSSQFFHGTSFVWGANHNAYNTQWQQSDSPGCDGATPLFPQAGTSASQQTTSREMLVPFFRATVGASANQSIAYLFNPTNPVPLVIDNVTNIARGYLPSPIGTNVNLLETFSRATGTSDTGIPTTSAGVSVVHQSATYEHYTGTRVATVSWSTSSPANRFFQVNFSPAVDMAGSKALSFRTALRCFASICSQPASDQGEMSYALSLIDSSGTASNAYSTAGRVRISRPIGDTSGNLHSTLYTVEIPLAALHGANLNQIKSVRFTFTQKPAGVVDLADLALLKTDPLLGARPPAAVAAQDEVAQEVVTAQMRSTSTPASPSAASDGNTIRVVRGGPLATATADAGADATTVDVVLTSKRSFPVTDALPKLKIGNEVIRGGNIAADGKTMTVTVPKATFDKLSPGADVSLSILASSPIWQFGALPK